MQNQFGWLISVIFCAALSMLAGCGTETQVVTQAPQLAPEPTPSPEEESPSPFYAGMQNGVQSLLKSMETALANYDEWQFQKRLESEIHQMARVSEDLLQTTQYVPLSALAQRSVVELTNGSSYGGWNIAFTFENPAEGSAPIRIIEQVRVWLRERPQSPYGDLRVRIKQEREDDLETNFPADVPTLSVGWEPLKSDPSLSVPLNRVVRAQSRASIQVGEILPLGTWKNVEYYDIPRMDVVIREIEPQHPIKRFYVALASARQTFLQTATTAAGKTLLAYFHEKIRLAFEETRGAK